MVATLKLESLDYAPGARLTLLRDLLAGTPNPGLEDVTVVRMERSTLGFNKQKMAELKKPLDLFLLRIEPTEMSREEGGYVPGYYLMTKREFGRAFKTIIQSTSWRTKGSYYYPANTLAPEVSTSFFISD